MPERFVSYLRAHSAEIFSHLLVAAAVAAGTLLLGRLLARGAARLLSRGAGRGKTLAPIMRTLIWFFAVFAAAVMACDQMGINVGTILAGAGVFGLAVGFGAQTLVKDCLSGFFLIMDNVLTVGDVVDIDGQAGVVERVGLRLTQLRNGDGKLWYIPNGSILKVGNASRDWVSVRVEVVMPRGASLDAAFALLERAGSEFAGAHPGELTAPPKVDALGGVNDEKVTLRLDVRVHPQKGGVGHFQSDLRARVQRLFDGEKATTVTRGAGAVAEA
jgi:moderate conductance mechanosensitive channel